MAAATATAKTTLYGYSFVNGSASTATLFFGLVTSIQ
jgi:hypothetical protein